MQQLEYVGAHPEVWVPNDDGEEPSIDGVERETPIGVSDGLAERLLEQDTWRVAVKAVVATPGTTTETGDE